MKRLIFRIILIIMALFVFFKGIFALYRYVNHSEPDAKDRVFRKIHMLFDGRQTNRAINFDRNTERTMYSFQRMISLIEACQKVKYLEHLYFSDSAGKPSVDVSIIRDLIKAMRQEKILFKRYITYLKGHSKEPLSTKKLRSLLYYLHVVEEGIQDLEIIVTNRMVH